MSPPLPLVLRLWVLVAAAPCLAAAAPPRPSAARRSPEPDQLFQIPDGWRHEGRVGPSEPLSLTFALRQQDVGRLARVVEAVSSPDSPAYGQFLTLEEVQALVTPSSLAVDTIHKWLEAYGIQGCQTVHTGDFLQCLMPANVAEQLLLGAQFHRYRNGESSAVRSPFPYTLQKELAEHVEFVGGLHRFPAERKAAIRGWAGEEAVLSSFHLGVTPAVIRKRYNLTARDVGAAPNNSQACAQVTASSSYRLEKVLALTSFSHEPEVLEAAFRVFDKTVLERAGLALLDRLEQELKHSRSPFSTTASPNPNCQLMAGSHPPPESG